MTNKEIANYLNIRSAEATPWRNIYNVVKEIIQQFNFEWYIEAGKDAKYHTPVLNIIYKDGDGHISFPLPEKYVFPGEMVVHEPGHQYTTGYAYRLFALLHTVNNPVCADIDDMAAPQYIYTEKQAPMQFNKQVITDIMLELDKDYLIPLSWGMLNEVPGINNEGHTYLQFDVDSSFLYKGMVRIVCTGKTYGFELFRGNGLVLYSEYGLTLSDCITRLDMKIESGPSKQDYKNTVEAYFNNEL